MDYGKSRRHNPSTSKKRSHFSSDYGKRKRLDSRHDDGPMSSQPVETIYRILCPGKKIGSVLGRGGQIVKALREETKAKIRVADSIPGADDRVIIIFDYQNQSEKSDVAVQNISNNDDLEDMKLHCFAQDALLKIHDKIAADDDPNDGVVQENPETADGVIARILVPGNQVGCLLGKGGSIIKQLRNDTGAGIRVLPSENLPECALKTDELVQISGEPSVVRKALYAISTRLHQHPRKENPPLEEIIHASTQRFESSPPLRHENPMLPQLRTDHALPMPLLDTYGDRPLQYPFSEAEEFSIRILCASELIGPVIGKSGSNVRQIEQQTGARVLVQELGKYASGERLIVLSSKEIPADPISPAIEALILLHGKVSETSEKRHLITRLVVPSKKVGCILGEGGKVITEMRRRTGAEIRVYSKADKPKYLSFDDELVQVAGPPDIARGAVTEIASRLRARILGDGSSAHNPPPVAPFDGPPIEIFPSRDLVYGRPANPPYGRHTNDLSYERLANDSPYRGPTNDPRYGRPANDPRYGRPANDPPYERPTNDPPYGRSANDPPYGRPANDPPYGRPANDPPYGRPANDPPYGRPANDPPYGRPANDQLYGRPTNDPPYGRPDNNIPHDTSSAYPVDYFSKRREYHSGSHFVSSAPASASFDRYAAPAARLPTREFPMTGSPGADYMSHRSYRDHVPSDSYPSRGTHQLGLLRADNSNVQQLGVTRTGNSNAYDYTEAAGEMHGREDYRRLTGVSGYSGSSMELRIPNSYMESVIGVDGANLDEMRQISGARMKLHKAQPGSSEFIMEIQGMPDQVSSAQRLLQGYTQRMTYR